MSGVQRVQYGVVQLITVLVTPLAAPSTVAPTLEFPSHLHPILKREGTLEARGPAIMCWLNGETGRVEGEENLRMTGMADTASTAGTQRFTAQKSCTGHIHDEGPKCGIHICFNSLA